MNNSYELFEVNTDAVATNRGFYYQYLIVLEKWLLNFISEEKISVYTEVDDDIKEVGQDLMFTQVKCYSSGFSLNSEEIKKTIFNFFMHFIKYYGVEKIRFCFNSNANVLKSEKLLASWIKNPVLSDPALRAACVKKIKEILNNEVNFRTRKKLERKENHDEIKKKSIELKSEFNSEKLSDFIDCIRWEFTNIKPDEAIKEVLKKINILFEHEKFCNKPVKILQTVLLSEIYKCSQLSDKEKRVVTNDRLNELIKKTDDELSSCTNIKIVKLFDLQFEQIKTDIEELQSNQIQQKLEIQDLSKKVISLEDKNDAYSLAKYLTLVPTVTKVIYGIDNSLSKIHELLENNRVVSIVGDGGTGKSFLTQSFANKNLEKYDHYIWIDASPTLIEAITLNVLLLVNLDISFTKNESINQRFDVIYNQISKIDGNVFFVIDGFEKDIECLMRLTTLRNCHFIITSRCIIDGIVQYKIPLLEQKDLELIFNSNVKRDVYTDPLQFKEFIEFVEFNPLVTELYAKLISNSIDLNLTLILNHLKSQTMNDIELDVTIKVDNISRPVRLLTYLKEFFLNRNLSQQEYGLLVFLSLLPSEEISIDQLAKIGGKESYKANKIFFVNSINELYSRGWIERNGDKVKMFRLMKELIKYDEREKLNAYITSVFLIIWLTHRINESIRDNPKGPSEFLKYAESILNSIKEPNRTSIYQPLIFLENALLLAYSIFDSSKGLLERWIDLEDRASKALSNDDPNVGVIYSNIAIVYLKNDNLLLADSYYSKSIKILNNHEKETFDTLIFTNLNLALIKFRLGDFENGNIYLKHASVLKRKYLLKENEFTSDLYNSIGLELTIKEDLENAAVFFEKAVEEQLSVDFDHSDDSRLAVFYLNFGYTLFLLDRHEDVVINFDKAANILEKIQSPNELFFNKVYKLFILIYGYYGKIESVKKFKEKVFN